MHIYIYIYRERENCVWKIQLLTHKVFCNPGPGKRTSYLRQLHSRARAGSNKKEQ